MCVHTFLLLHSSGTYMECLKRITGLKLPNKLEHKATMAILRAQKPCYLGPLSCSIESVKGMVRS